MFYDLFVICKDFEDVCFIGCKKWFDVDIVKVMFKDCCVLVDCFVIELFLLILMILFFDEVMDLMEVYNVGIMVINGVVLLYQCWCVLVYEVWFKVLVEIKWLCGSMFYGEQYDEFFKGYVDVVNSGEVEVIKKVFMCVYVMIFIEVGVFWYLESLYWYN